MHLVIIQKIATGYVCYLLSTDTLIIFCIWFFKVWKFGNNDSSFKSVMTGSMGFVVCIINSIMSIYMIVKANRNLK